MAEMSVAEMSIGRKVRGRKVRGRNVLAETSVAEMSVAEMSEHLLVTCYSAVFVRIGFHMVPGIISLGSSLIFVF